MSIDCERQVWLGGLRVVEIDEYQGMIENLDTRDGCGRVVGAGAVPVVREGGRDARAPERTRGAPG